MCALIIANKKSSNDGSTCKVQQTNKKVWETRPSSSLPHWTVHGNTVLKRVMIGRSVGCVLERFTWLTVTQVPGRCLFFSIGYLTGSIYMSGPPATEGFIVAWDVAEFLLSNERRDIPSFVTLFSLACTATLYVQLYNHSLVPPPVPHHF